MAASSVYTNLKPTKKTLQAAKAFVKLLRLTSSDPRYDFGILWYLTKIKGKPDVLTARDRTVFDSDVASNKFGRVHKKVLTQIENVLIKYEPPAPPKLRQTKSKKEPTEKQLTDRLKAVTPKEKTGKKILEQPQKNKKENTKKPVVVLEATKEMVSKGEKFQLKWESTNASSVIAADFKAKETSGIIELSIVRTTTYEIIVSGPGGTAEAKIKIICDDDFEKALNEAKALVAPTQADAPDVPEAKEEILDKLPQDLFSEFITDRVKGYVYAFRNDFDQACFILATKSGPVGKNNRHFLWAQQVSGQNISVIKEHGKKVAKLARDLAQKSEPRR